ncbi:uncharacterized protein LOC118348292 [Juglans regia]|uniref:Uncharacterized protein LOC118348292 n=1 Tax=Juglans regia TaxID=51240 RepID=A0A6P9EBD8_JUGRE|nr:uncharacterized protein LOC118348292 [Juglans regia]
MRTQDGVELNSPEEIHNGAIEYFADFLKNTNQSRVLPDLSDLISPVINVEDCTCLCRTPSLDEVKEALSSIPINSSPGSDGFGAGWFKLNTDGSSLGNPRPSGVGGIIRNNQGHLVHAFNSYIGFGSNNRVELLALLRGLKACKNLGIIFVEIELDSQVVISWWNRRRCGIWYLEDFWEDTLALMDSMVCTVRHVYREALDSDDQKHASSTQQQHKAAQLRSKQMDKS